MIYRNTVAVLFFIQVFASILFASVPVRIAVLDFDNMTGKVEYDHFKKGLREYVQSDIRLPEDFMFVEREKINDLQKEINLSNSNLFDASTALKTGRFLSATHVIVGSFSYINGKWLLNLRFIHVETGVILAMFNEKCTDDNLLDKVSMLANKVQNSLSPAKVNRFDSQDELRVVHGETIKTFSDFSLAISKYEKGDKEAFARYFAQLSNEDLFTLADCYFYGRGCEVHYGKALSIYKQLAQSGNAKAQGRLSYCYFNGKGVDRNVPEGLLWVQSAAKQGDIYASVFLGLIYLEGWWGIKKLPEKAIKLLQYAADQGDIDGLQTMGECYCKGEGVPQNYSKALEYFNKAAALGDLSSRLIQGVIYYNGYITDRNFKKAFEIFRECATMGLARANWSLGVCYREGRGVERNLQKSVECFKKGVLLNDEICMKELGLCYLVGLGVEKNTDEAIRLLKKAAEDVESVMIFLAFCYEKGLGVDIDLVEVEKWQEKVDIDCKEASECLLSLGRLFIEVNDFNSALMCFMKSNAYQDNAHVLNWIGVCYKELGYYSKAIGFFNKAIERDETYAMVNLGECYYLGHGVSQNYKKAFQLFSNSSRQDNERGLYYLGLCYIKGHGVVNNTKKGLELWQKSAELEAELAQRELGKCYLEGTLCRADLGKALYWLRKAASHDEKEAIQLLESDQRLIKASFEAGVRNHQNKEQMRVASGQKVEDEAQRNTEVTRQDGDMNLDRFGLITKQQRLKMCFADFNCCSDELTSIVGQLDAVAFKAKLPELTDLVITKAFNEKAFILGVGDFSRLSDVPLMRLLDRNTEKKERKELVVFMNMQCHKKRAEILSDLIGWKVSSEALVSASLERVIRDALKEKHHLYKAGEMVKITARIGRRDITINGVLHQVAPQAIKVGWNTYFTKNLPEEVLCHFYSDLNDKLIKREFARVKRQLETTDIAEGITSQEILNEGYIPNIGYSQSNQQANSADDWETVFELRERIAVKLQKCFDKYVDNKCFSDSNNDGME